MDAERMREYLLGMPDVIEATQWGNLIYWVGPQVVGGKMFAMLDPDMSHGLVMSFPAGEEHFQELAELEGVVPAPYMARIFWVGVERWESFKNAEWEAELRASYELTRARLPAMAKKVLAMPKVEQKKAVAERKRVLAERDAAKN